MSACWTRAAEKRPFQWIRVSVRLAPWIMRLQLMRLESWILTLDALRFKISVSLFNVSESRFSYFLLSTYNQTYPVSYTQGTGDLADVTQSGSIIPSNVSQRDMKLLAYQGTTPLNIGNSFWTRAGNRTLLLLRCARGVVAWPATGKPPCSKLVRRAEQPGRLLHSPFPGGRPVGRATLGSC